MKGLLCIQTLINCYLKNDGQKFSGHIDKFGLDHIFTITSAIEEFQGTGSSIEKYYESDLI